MRRSRVAAVIGGCLAALAGLYVIGQGLNTLDRLTFVEHERDAWQRASDLIAQLALHNGSRVVDLGCGAGYFALKLSAAVGTTGSVQAVDIQRLPLTFLWLRGGRNIHEVLGEPDDPHITGPVDSVLIANTYHELANPHVVLMHLRNAMATDARIVIADRTTGDHSIDPSLVEAELRRCGFAIAARDDHFTDQPGEGLWWMIAARKASL